MTNYYNKYLKYKIKYLKLKEGIRGGAEEEEAAAALDRVKPLAELIIPTIVHQINMGLLSNQINRHNIDHYLPEDFDVNRQAAVGKECGDDVGDDEYGHTMVTTAAKTARSIDFLRYLFEKRNADINAKNKKGQTPLMVAVLYGNLPAVQFLLQNQILARDNEYEYRNRTAYDYAENIADAIEKCIGNNGGEISFEEFNFRDHTQLDNIFYDGIYKPDHTIMYNRMRINYVNIKSLLANNPIATQEEMTANYREIQGTLECPLDDMVDYYTGNYEDEDEDEDEDEYKDDSPSASCFESPRERRGRRESRSESPSGRGQSPSRGDKEKRDRSRSHDRYDKAR